MALTLGVPLKWVDNLLSHHSVPGVSQSRQGVERRITDQGLLAIEAIRLLTLELGVPLSRAAEIARSAVMSRAEARMQFVGESGIAIVFPIAETERRLRAKVLEAVDGVASIARGRPRRESR